jgi:hypothetical protein
MVDEERVDAGEPVAAVEIVELQTVLEGERHRWRLKIVQCVGGRVLSAKRRGLTIYRNVRVHTNGRARKGAGRVLIWGRRLFNTGTTGGRAYVVGSGFSG